MYRTKDVFVVCPKCGKYFNVSRLFYSEPRYASIKLHCPYCGVDFDKSEARVIGL